MSTTTAPGTRPVSSYRDRGRELVLLAIGLLGYRAAAVLATPFLVEALGATRYAQLAVVEAGCALAQLALGGFVTAAQAAVVARGEGGRARGYAGTAALLALAGGLLAVPVCLALDVPWALAAAANCTALGLNALWVLRAQRRLGLFAALTGVQTVVAGALLALAVGTASPALWLLAQPVSVLVVAPVAWALTSGKARPGWTVLRRALPALPFEAAVLAQLSLPVLAAGWLLGAGPDTALLGVAAKAQLVLWAVVAVAGQVLGPRVAAGRVVPRVVPAAAGLLAAAVLLTVLAGTALTTLPVALLGAGLLGQAGVAVVDAAPRQALLGRSAGTAARTQLVGAATLAVLLLAGLPALGLAAVGPALVAGELATSAAVRRLGRGS